MDFLILGAPAVIYTWYTATHNANIGQDRKYNRIKVTFYSPHSRQLELFLCFSLKFAFSIPLWDIWSLMAEVYNVKVYSG